MRKWVGLAGMAFALVSAIALAVSPAFAEDPKTKLGKWMKPNMGRHTAAADPGTDDGKEAFAKLKASFDKLVAAGAPAGDIYKDWIASAQDGSAAAAANDLPAVKKACGRCHGKDNVTKKQYIKDYPDRDAPP
jgi:hypothetical protein